MCTNENTAIGLFKEAVLKILLEPVEKKCTKKLSILICLVVKTLSKKIQMCNTYA